MIAQLAILRMIYWLFTLLAAVVVLFKIGNILVPLLVFGMLFASIPTIPFQLAWDARTFRNLLLQSATTITYAVFLYGVLYWKTGLVVSGELLRVPLSDAVYFSAATWTTIAFGDILPSPDARVLTVVEAITAYVTMAILIALIVLWIEQSLSSAQRYVAWLQKTEPEDIKKATGIDVEELLRREKEKREPK